jgi:peptidyl-prolyl cis-trans isomerase D
MRNMAQSWLVKALLSLLIVSFGIWGIGDMFRGHPEQRAVATVGSEKITVAQLEHRFRTDMPEARQVFGPELTDQQARQVGVLDRALDLLIKYATADQEIKRLGLDVSDRLVMEKIASQPALHDKDGKFNPALFRNALGKSGISERLFLDDQKETMARRLLFQEIVNNAPLPQTFIDDIYRARGSRRILEVLSLSNDSISDIAEPEDKDIKAFYEAHGDLFKAPEYRALTIGVLSGDEMSKDINPTEEDLKKAYETRTDAFTHPELRDLVQVVLQDEEKAKQFAEAAQASGNLATTAKAKGLTPVPLDHMDEKSILPELYTTVFALEEGQVSAPVKSPLGWHVLQLKKIHPSGVTSFEDAKKDLLETLKKEQEADRVAKTVNELDDDLAANKPLEEIADSLRLRLIKIPAIDAQSVPMDGKKIESFPAKEDVMKAAFSQATGETSQIIDDKAGNYVVVRTDDITPSQVRPFEKVKDQVVKSLEDERRAEKAQKEAEDIAKALREGKKASSFAAQSGVEVRLSKPISMLGEVDKDLPKEAYSKIFQMKEGDVVTVPAKDKQFVLRLTELVQVDPSKPSPAKEKVTEDLTDRVPMETAEEYENFLHIRYPVHIDETLLETLKKQGS